ncbi:polyprenyl synthetase family protein [Gammaproteobacteria bacterium]|nr:polyprenyl synthetase family protein [Gammaproteobacteria bacterium]MDC0091875.1 polyprenyl synthetase family protein [Gammaproteobacteria bacterium]
MSLSFLSECKTKIFKKIDSLLGADDQITKSMRYSALAESKCIRAGLVFASGQLTDHNSELGLVDMATSIELMHTYSLIHDDLPAMDNDDMRRGKASNHVAFNEATAILAGDALQALAFKVIASSQHIQSEQKIEIIQAMSSACGHQGMVLGQQYDLDAEQKKFHDIEEIHTLKTGRLIQVALTMPHLADRSNSTPLSILNELGQTLGLAFQIMDDVLEASSNSQTLGKSNLSDIENSKMTYVSEFGLAESEKRADDLSVWCAEKINTAFDHSKAKDLKDLAHFMVARSN